MQDCRDRLADGDPVAAAAASLKRPPSAPITRAAAGRGRGSGHVRGLSSFSTLASDFGSARSRWLRTTPSFSAACLQAAPGGRSISRRLLE